jgi:hypothetical protein
MELETVVETNKMKCLFEKDIGCIPGTRADCADCPNYSAIASIYGLIEEAEDYYTKR